MKALTFQGKGKVKLSEVSDPKLLKPTDAIIRIRLTAICGSDLHVYHEREKGIEIGTTMGHEAIGEVIELGSDVTQFSVGDKVFVPFTTSCGACFYCGLGLSARCVESELFGWVEKAKGLQGLQAEYARIPLADSTLVKIPSGISNEEALLLGDVFPTGFQCAEKVRPHSHGTYVVVGCGPIGLMAVVSAKLLGAKHLYAIDAVSERLSLAAEYGAIPLPLNSETVNTIRAVTNGRGADGVLEAVGSESAQRLCFELIRPGGNVSLAGVHTASTFAFSPVEAYDKNLTLSIGRCPARSYAERALSLIPQIKPKISRIITHRMPLADGEKGYQIFDEKKEGCVKLILQV